MSSRKPTLVQQPSNTASGVSCDPSYGHYFKDVSFLDTVDVYRVLDLFDVTHPCLQHAIKKLLCAGQRGNKDQSKDVREAIVSLSRWEEMQAEDEG